MVDLAAFAIFDVSGPGALDYLQGLAVTQIDVPVGRVVYTPLLAENGGILADLTIMRLGPRHASASSPAAAWACATRSGSRTTCRPTARPSCTT